MVKKWYLVTAAKPGTRLGIYDNWHEVAPNVLGVTGSIFKSYETEEEAIEMWERSERAAQEQARRMNRARAHSDAYAPAFPSHDVSVDGRAHSRNDECVVSRVRSITLNGSLSYASSRPRPSSQRGTSTARAPSQSAVARPHSIQSPQRSGVQPRRVPADVSYSTQAETMVRTRSAPSGRTSSWVAEWSAALPPVPESPRISETSRARTRSAGAVGDRHPLRQRPIRVDIASPSDRRATVDTSYSDAYADAINISSSDSSLSSEEDLPPPPPPWSSQVRALPRSRPQVWVDNGFYPGRLSPTQPGSNRSSSSESSIYSPHRAALPSSKAPSTPEVWASPLSHMSSARDAVGNSVSASPRESLRASPSRSSRTAPQNQLQPRTPERRRTLVASSDLAPILSCQCDHAVCPCCHLPTKPASPSNIYNEFGFTQPPHIANIVYPPNADPRSPMRTGGSRVPANSNVFIGRPSPLMPAQSSLFST